MKKGSQDSSDNGRRGNGAALRAASPTQRDAVSGDGGSVEAPAMASPFERELAFTRTYRQFREAHPAIREAMCLRAQYPRTLAPVRSGDLFAGRLNPALVGFSPDEWGPTAFGYYCRFEEFEERPEWRWMDDQREEEVSEMLDFWRNEHTSGRLRAAYPPEMAASLPSDDWMASSGVAFPLYRLTGANVDFGKLLRLGIEGLRAEVGRLRDEAIRLRQDDMFFVGLTLALKVLKDTCRWYAAEIRKQIRGTREDDDERAQMAKILDRVSVKPPATFREAAQLFWVYSVVSDVRNYGRMDVYLGDFLARDLEEGVLTEHEALRLLQSLWQLMADRNTRVHGRVIIGGRGRPNEANADRFAMLAMEASRTVLEIEPQLSLRLYEGINPALFEKALDVVAEGRTYPILYNDEVNIPSVQRAFGFDGAEAEQYVPYGCGEYILEHRSFGTPSGVINLLKALEVTLRNGTDPVTNLSGGLALGAAADFETFDQLWEAYCRQVEHFVRLLADQQMLEYRIAAGHAPFLYLSLLYDDCLERGRPIFSGGIRYLGGTLETYGNANVADSLFAIKRLVFEEKAIGLEELVAALDANFDGFDVLRAKLRALPKYGNDDDEADAMLLRVHEHVCNYVKEQAARVGLHSYLVVIINNSANTLMGRQTAASADGRRAGEPMNNGNNPSSGADRNGVTAFLNSILKPATDIHAGAVQNMKFSRELLLAHRGKVKALLEAYFAGGGPQAMITVVSKGDLEAAMEAPEKYGHIFVRVGGFSARFVELPRDVQLEILHRTLY